MRIVRMYVFRRLFDHALTNEQYEVELKVRGSQAQMNEIVKMVAEKCCTPSP